MAVHILEVHPVMAREAHLVSAQVEAVAGVLVSEEAVSVAEEPVADSKHNKRESFRTLPFVFFLSPSARSAAGYWWPGLAAHQ